MESNHPKQAAKRRLDCCVQNEQQRKSTRARTVECDYCECVFDGRDANWYYESVEGQREWHMDVHKCSVCHDIALDDDERIHRVRHRQEAQLAQLQEQRQRQMDDDFVLCYVKANRLNEYRPQLDYEPDIDYIVLNYQFEKDEWLSFMKKFKRPILKLFFGSFEADHHLVRPLSPHWRLTWKLNPQIIGYLLENRALSIHDATDFLNILVKKVGSDDYVFVIVSYLLDTSCKIKAEWVAKAIHDDRLIERIKEKQPFTFGDIHKAREWQLFSPFDVKGMKTFYDQLQKHFFNPEFESILADLHNADFKRAQDKPARIHQPYRYNYDEAKDTLSVVVKSRYRPRTYSLGSCTETMSKSLNELMKEYIKEMKVYDEFHSKLYDLIGDDINGSDGSDCYEYYFYETHKFEVVDHQRIKQRRKLSKLYFVISMK